jgi:hypothetical protein
MMNVGTELGPRSKRFLHKPVSFSLASTKDHFLWRDERLSYELEVQQ